MVTDIHQPALQISIRTGIETGLAESFAAPRQDQLGRGRRETHGNDAHDRAGGLCSLQLSLQLPSLLQTRYEPHGQQAREDEDTRTYQSQTWSFGCCRHFFLTKGRL